MMKRFKSDPHAVVYETSLGPTEAGVMPKRKMKIFDDLCLTPIEELSPEGAAEMRENYDFSDSSADPYAKRRKT